MKLTDIIAELSFSIYTATVRIRHSSNASVQNIGEQMRAMPGVLTISQISHEKASSTAVMGIKLMTTKPPLEAYEAFKDNAVSKLPEVLSIDVAESTIEKKK